MVGTCGPHIPSASSFILSCLSLYLLFLQITFLNTKTWDISSEWLALAIPASMFNTIISITSGKLPYVKSVSTVKLKPHHRKHNHNAKNMDKFDVLVSHSLTITSLHIYLTFIGMWMYVVGLFAQVTCAPELIFKSVQSEIAHSTHLVGVP